VNPIPTGFICFGVSSRTVTAMTGVTSYGVSGTSNTTQFGDLLGIAAGFTNFSIIGPNPFFSPTPVVITANGGNFTGGQERLSMHVMQVTPAQS
jgi:hypothetical protein